MAGVWRPGLWFAAIVTGRVLNPKATPGSESDSIGFNAKFSLYRSGSGSVNTLAGRQRRTKNGEAGIVHT